jgi:hypothetical protein
MPFPFGVSVGDFIACIELINIIIKSMNDSQGSATRYQGLIQSLKSLEVALTQVDKVKPSNSDESVALRQASMQCCSTLSSFVQKMNKYQPSLRLRGSGNQLKDGLRKVQWALYTKDDIAHFQAEIRGHVDSILLLLHTVHVYVTTSNPRSRLSLRLNVQLGNASNAFANHQRLDRYPIANRRAEVLATAHVPSTHAMCQSPSECRPHDCRRKHCTLLFYASCS